MRDALFIKYTIVRHKNTLWVTNWLCSYTISVALFLLLHPDYMLRRVEPIFVYVNPTALAIGLLLSSVALLVSVWFDIDIIRRWSTRMLSFILGGFFALSVAYHWGTGYPDLTWIQYLFLVIMVLIVGYKQTYTEKG